MDRCSVISSVSRARARRSGAIGVMSPKKWSRMWSFSMVSTASSRYRFSRAMMAETSTSDRFQFSVEKAYTVRYFTPMFLQ